MSQIIIPKEIDRIFDKPGRDWTDEERARINVKEWLNTSPQREYLLFFALRKLGPEATPEDAQDTWGNFDVDMRRAPVTERLDEATSEDAEEDAENAQAPVPKRLDSVIDHYDPAKGRRFWNYLLFCFERFCWDEGKKIRRRQGKEGPLMTQIETDEGDIIEVEIADEKPNRETELVQQVEEQEEEQKRARRVLAIQKCVNNLPSTKRRVIVAFHFEGKSYGEIEKEMGMAKGSAKVRCFEARQMLRECLRKEGVEL